MVEPETQTAQARSASRVLGRARAAVVFLVNLGAAKAITFFAPIMLAARLDAATYGAIELALATGLILSIFGSLGTTLAIPQVTLRRRPVPVLDIVAIVTGVCCTVFAMVAIAVMSAGGSAVLALAMGVSAVTTIQGAGAMLAQTASRRNAAAWLSSLAILVIVLVVLLTSAFRLEGVAALAWCMAAVAALCAVGCGYGAMTCRKPELATRWREVMREALPLLGAGVVAVWIGNSGRFLMGIGLPLEDVGLYSFEFRLASVVLIMHQVIALGLFAHLYSLPGRQFDRLGAVYMVLVAAVLIVLVLLFPTIVRLFEIRALARRNITEAIGIFPFVALTVQAWLASAAPEMRIARVRRAGRAALASAAVVALIGALFILLSSLGAMNLRLATIGLAIQMWTIVAVQLLVLRRRGLLLRRFAVAAAAGAASLAACGVLFST